MSDFLPDLDPSESPLNAESKRNLIRATIDYFTSRSISATDALTTYRERGLGIRESDFYAIYREVSGITIRANRINGVNLSRIPTDGVFEYKEYNQKQRYRFDIASTIYDPETGYKRQEVRTVYRSTLEDMRTMRGSFQEYFNEYNAFQDEEIGDVTILGAYIDDEVL